MRLHRRSKRTGAYALESAVVFPVFFFLLMAIIVGGNGVFRAQQIACLAQEASRWASVHGSHWATTTNSTPSRSQDVYDQAVAPIAVGLDPASLTVQVWWVDGTTGLATPWDSSTQAPTTLDANNNTVSNRVRVTVSYQWFAERSSPGL